MREPPRPTKATMLMDYPWVLVRFRCHHCERSRDARLAVLAARFGANTMIDELLKIFMGRCPWNPYSELHKPRKYGHRCGAYCPDLLRAGPPDLPPAMGGLTVIEGARMRDDRPSAPTHPSNVASAATIPEAWRHQVELKLDRAAALERLRRIEAWCGEWQIGFRVIDPWPAATTLRLAFEEARLARAFMGHFGGVSVPDDESERALGDDAAAEDAYDRLAREYDVED